MIKNKVLYAMFAVLLLSGCINYSEGSRHGVITKFTHKGFVCKTWEGELSVSNLALGIGEKFYFTVEGDDVINKVQSAMNSGKDVTVFYKQELFTQPCRTDSDNYFVTDVK